MNTEVIIDTGQAPYSGRMRTLLFVFLLLAGLLAPLRGLVGQSADSLPPIRSSMAGVYSAEQATRGEDTYASICASCHTISEITGTNFTKKWVGFPLWDLYSYLAESMPQSDPGSLTPTEYAQVVGYILKLNNQPAGAAELPADTLTLKRIKVDTLPVDTLLVQGVRVDTVRVDTVWVDTVRVDPRSRPGFYRHR